MHRILVLVVDLDDPVVVGVDDHMAPSVIVVLDPGVLWVHYCFHEIRTRCLRSYLIGMVHFLFHLDLAEVEIVAILLLLLLLLLRLAQTDRIRVMNLYRFALIRVEEGS